MKQFNPFPPLNSQYGARLGRDHDNPANFQDLPKSHRIYARHQGGLGDGYDRGGAYWGFPSNVWGVWTRLDGEVIVTYVRASSREDAIRKVREGLE